VRVDTHLVAGHTTIVSADFDSLIAKIIVTASSWPDTVRKAQRALSDTHIAGVKTNIDVLRGVVAHEDFMAGRCDTQWLERKQTELVERGVAISKGRKSAVALDSESATPAIQSAGSTLFRKGDAWNITLSSPSSSQANATPTPPTHHLNLTRLLRSDFPTSLSAEILFTTPSTQTSTAYTLTLNSTTSSAASASSSHRRADPRDATHVGIPFPGKLVEVLVDEGDSVREGDTVCVVQQMKMELEVRSHRSGRVTWVTDAEDGEDVAEGVMVCVVEGEMGARL
jgi:acetyl/propionyl-CoA carboxylase alpha subunit